MTRALLISFFMMVLTPLVASAQGGGEPAYKAGQHYQVLENPVRTRNPEKVEVVEVFWYGCGHCYRFEPLVQAWKKKLPEDVDFWQSPAMWSGVMRTHAQAYFTAVALGVLDKVHDPIFTALNVEREPLASEESLADLFAEYGVDPEDFSKAFNSFAVTSQVKQADARARSYKISGTPEMVVNGKYRITAKMAGGQANMLKVAEYLIAKEREAMGLTEQ